MNSWFTHAPLIQSMPDKGLFINYDKALTMKKAILGAIHKITYNGILVKILFFRN